MNILILALLFPFTIWAKPYPDPNKVTLPKTALYSSSELLVTKSREIGSQVLRVEVSWNKNETYKISGLFIEHSGTEALKRSAIKKDSLGSFKGKLSSNNVTLHYSLGTGREFRQLVRTLSFRFPLSNSSSDFTFIMEAENPQTGAMEKVLEQKLDLSQAQSTPQQEVKVTLLRTAKKTPALMFNFYSEGFDASGEKKFLDSAKKAISVFEKNLPGHEYFEFKAVFAPSKEKIGRAQDRGEEVKIQESFLGLYFPHWRKFGRWYHVVYPTSVTKYRNSLAQVPYDYPLALVDDGGYWGVGNYKELTAVPVSSMQFSYLLLHEFGHFMGLNEEYEGGGPTELEFAPGIKEPWSQNITFNTDPVSIKWSRLLEPGISVPTTQSDYRRFGGARKNPVGAYRGGYADSEPKNKSHKPVMKCMMASGGDFCPVCQQALQDLVKQDLGI